MKKRDKQQEELLLGNVCTLILVKVKHFKDDIKRAIFLTKT